MKFCSLSCKSKAFKRLYLKNRKFKKCKQCKNIYFKINKYYCSKKCYNQAKVKYNFKPCLECGRLFRPSNKKYYCSYNCYFKNKLKHTNILALQRNAHAQQKASDKNILKAWDKCKKDATLPFSKVFGELGYKRFPPKRLKKLVSMKELKIMGELRGYKNHNNSRYKTGRHIENLCAKIIRKKGYYVILSRNSQGVFDIIGVKKTHFLFIQCKTSRIENLHISSKELLAIKNFSCPKNSKKEIWIRYIKQGHLPFWDKQRIK